jgi:hypothetical protein
MGEVTQGRLSTSMNNDAGAVQWMCPERLTMQTEDEEIPRRIAPEDVYSFGCVCIEVGQILRSARIC